MKCRDLTQQVILVPKGSDTNRPLQHAYQLFESGVSGLQTQLHENKEEQTEHTSVLLKNQYIAFLEAHKVLKEHFKESIVTEEVLRSWVTYYGQVF